MTNEEKLREIFPKTIFIYRKEDGKTTAIQCSDEWWNAEYKEPTTKNEAKYCDSNICLKNEYNNVGCEDCEVTKSQESTTKNDLGVDCISRAQTQTEIEMNASRYTIAKERGGMGQVEWSDRLIKVSDAVDIIRNMPSVTPQEPQSFRWCTDCKEYDQEKHCCHRWSKVIRDTVEEMKQEPKTGHWIPTYGNVKCSVCGSVKDSRDVGKATHYCDFCGAKMIEPQESGG